MKNYTIHLDESAERDDGSIFPDHEVRARLKAKGFANVELEWMGARSTTSRPPSPSCAPGRQLTGTHHETFAMRPEQAEAVNKTHAYYHSIWEEDMHAVPRFLWNAKMRFGKTFAAYQLAKKLGATQGAGRHVQAGGRGRLADTTSSPTSTSTAGSTSRRPTAADPTTADKKRPLVYFGSFQDLLGKDKAGNIKAKNEWLHTINWDLVVFDEYHFGAWRDNAKELFEGEDDAEAKKELEGRVQPRASTTSTRSSTSWARTRPSSCRSPPGRTSTSRARRSRRWRRASSSRSRSSTGPTPTSSAPRSSWPTKHPDKWNPYGALPEMRLLTYQMPDELIAIAKQGEFDEFDLNEFFAATGTGATREFKHKNDVQKWLDIIRGAYAATQVDNLKLGAQKPPFPYSDVRLLPYLQHSFWFLPSVAACHAMANLLAEKQNVFFHDYKVLTVAGTGRRHRAGRPAAGPRGDRQRASTRRPSPCRAASSPPA